MKTSSINHPGREILVVIRQWQLEFCLFNACAAALLSFFEYWHNIKLEQSEKNTQFNNMAENHGDGRLQDESLWQFHTEKQLEDGILIYKRDTINKAIDFLVSKNVLTIGRNPNPRYKFDKTRWFFFHPEVLNLWLENRSSSPSSKSPGSSSKNPSRQTENPSRQSESPSRQSESPSRSTINPVAISETSSEITTEITNKEKRIDTSLTLSGFSSVSSFNLFSSEERETEEGSNPNPNASPKDTSKETDNQQPYKLNDQAPSQPYKQNNATDNRSSHPAIAAVRGILGRFPNKLVWDEIIATVGNTPDLERLKRCATEWAKKTSNMGNLTWLFEWYKNGMPLGVQAGAVGTKVEVGESGKPLRREAMMAGVRERFLKRKALEREALENSEKGNESYGRL